MRELIILLSVHNSKPSIHCNEGKIQCEQPGPQTAKPLVMTNLFRTWYTDFREHMVPFNCVFDRECFVCHNAINIYTIKSVKCSVTQILNNVGQNNKTTEINSTQFLPTSSI